MGFVLPHKSQQRETGWTGKTERFQKENPEYRQLQKCTDVRISLSLLHIIHHSFLFSLVVLGDANNTSEY